MSFLYYIETAEAPCTPIISQLVAKHLIEYCVFIKINSTISLLNDNIKNRPFFVMLKVLRKTFEWSVRNSQIFTYITNLFQVILIKIEKICLLKRYQRVSSQNRIKFFCRPNESVIRYMLSFSTHSLVEISVF